MVAKRNAYEWLRRNWWFILACLIVAIIKLWAVNDLEIVAKNRPLDELWYIKSADNFYWFSESYDHLNFCRQPGYPLWIALVRLARVPLRVAMELLVIGASLSLSLALMATGLPILVGFLVYLLMAFHPYTFQLNCIALQDMFYGPLLWLCLAAMIMAYASRSTGKTANWAGIAGLLLGVLWNTRPETPLVVGLLAVACLLFVLAHHSGGRSWQNGLLRVAKTTLIISAGIAAITILICSANHLRFGLFVPYDLQTPGYKNAMNALLSVRTEKPIRHVSVSREAMSHAARISPSFREVEPLIEKWARKWYSRHEPPAPGEIVAGQFYWAFRRAAGQCGYHSSASAANTFYQQIADEINVACREGLIPCRTALVPIITSDLWALRKHIPSSFLRIVRVFMFEGRQLPYAKDDLASTRPSIRRLFDRVANRRIPLTQYQKVTVSGRTIHSSQPLSLIEIRDQSGTVVASTRPTQERHEQYLRDSVTDVMRIPKENTFRIAFTPTIPMTSGELVLKTYDDSQYVLPLDHIVRQRVESLPGRSPGDFIRYKINRIENLGTMDHTRARARDLTYALYKPIVVVLSFTGLVGMLAFIVLPSTLPKRRMLPVLIVLLFAVVSRVGLFTLLDATSWTADRIRYIYPVIPVYMATVVSFTFVGVQSVVCAVRERRTPRDPESGSVLDLGPGLDMLPYL